MPRCLAAERQFTGYVWFLLLLVIGALALVVGPVSATSIVPVTARELVARADVIVHGVVVSSYVGEDAFGRPETITIITPLEVLKGHVSGALVLHQLGGELPDGRFFKLWGQPEYEAGHEVVVFAIARPEGDHQTAELVLGKFEVQQDERGVSFAVPALVADAPVQVTVMGQRRADGPDSLEASPPDETLAPWELDGFLRALRGDGTTPQDWAAPRGALTSNVYPEYLTPGVPRYFINIGGLWRWNNGAAAVWTLGGQANITGGGTAEAANATATWNAQPNSTISYTIGSSGVNPIHLNALSSPCGWNTCMAGSGVIGCGGPGGGGSNAWRGETYGTITNGEVWLRAYCTFNLWDSITTQAVLTHELGHTLGLGHSDAGASPHDVCRGDEDAAQMRSFVPHRTTLGTDDEDAVRWLYGDAGNSCTDLLTFTDVPLDHAFFNFIEALAAAGITGGCSTSPPQYCPDAGVTRDQMAVFLLRGLHGAEYQPPAATGRMFTDVPLTQPLAKWIEQLALEGITGGCSTSPAQYCPSAGVTRAQMAVFLLRAKHGSGYQPPAATGRMFTDVPLTQPFAKWIEQLALEGITGGCGPTTYCPDTTVTRGQMAVFLVRTFNLPM